VMLNNNKGLEKGLIVYNSLCVPSQKGGFFVCLQPQRYVSSVFSAVNATGVIPVPL
jgi:hypothetical protein